MNHSDLTAAVRGSLRLVKGLKDDNVHDLRAHQEERARATLHPRSGNVSNIRPIRPPEPPERAA